MLKEFKPAFLGRINVIPYIPLGSDVLERIIHLQLCRIARRVEAHYDASFNYTVQVVSYLNCHCHDINSGARAIQNNLQNVLLPLLSSDILELISTRKEIESICVDVVNGNYEFVFNENTCSDKLNAT